LTAHLFLMPYTTQLQTNKVLRNCPVWPAGLNTCHTNVDSFQCRLSYNVHLRQTESLYNLSLPIHHPPMDALPPLPLEEDRRRSRQRDCVLFDYLTGVWCWCVAASWWRCVWLLCAAEGNPPLSWQLQTSPVRYWEHWSYYGNETKMRQCPPLPKPTHMHAPPPIPLHTH